MINLNDLAELRVPPHSIEAESSVLGGLLLDNGAWDRVGDLLNDSDFYGYEHRLIYAAMSSLINASRQADVITVFEHLQSQGKADETGGLAYLNALAQYVPSAGNIRRYAEIVRERHVLRDVQDLGRRISAAATEAKGDVAGLVEWAASEVMKLADTRHTGREPQLIGAMLPVLLEDLDMRMKSPGAISGLKTGFAGIDTITCGLQAGDLIIVAGRPSMGKTTLAVNIAENVAMNGGAAFIVSLEMDAKQLVERTIASAGSINTQTLRTGDLSESDIESLQAALHRVKHARLVIADDPALCHVPRIRMAARKQKQRMGGLDLIVVDYLQLMQGGGNNRNEDLGEITRALKLLARELGCPIVLLSQLSRKCEERTDRRPLLSDLRESGAIEQDADVVLMAYRDDYYNQNSRLKGYAEVLIRKHRMGPLGTVPLIFQGWYSRFLDTDKSAFMQLAAEAEAPKPSKQRGFR